MAENEEKRHSDIVLIAQVRAYLLDNEMIDLLPFRHEEDVRAEINKFIEDWAKSGFLLKANRLYPWHRVKSIEVVSVQELTQAQAGPFQEEWRMDSEAQQAFWKTRKGTRD
jgi:hypothetical protein